MIDEYALGGLVTFANAGDIVDVTLKLLRSPEDRWEIEQKCIQFIMQDQYQAEVVVPRSGLEVDASSIDIVPPELSSLSLLAQALNSLAGMCDDFFLVLVIDCRCPSNCMNAVHYNF